MSNEALKQMLNKHRDLVVPFALAGIVCGFSSLMARDSKKTGKNEPKKVLKTVNDQATTPISPAPPVEPKKDEKKETKPLEAAKNTVNPAPPAEPKKDEKKETKPLEAAKNEVNQTPKPVTKQDEKKEIKPLESQPTGDETAQKGIQLPPPTKPVSPDGEEIKHFPIKSLASVQPQIALPLVKPEEKKEEKADAVKEVAKATEENKSKTITLPLKKDEKKEEKAGAVKEIDFSRNSDEFLGALTLYL